jgi:shikimate kinase
MKGHGRARCHGAVTVVNAVATGKGAAMGVTLQAEAEVETRPSGHLVVDIVSEERETTSLVRACIQKAFAAGNCADLGAYVTTRSAIPAARGLKSSSAVANAVVLAALDAVDQAESMPDQELVRLGVEAAVLAGVTITGAFDDACACYFGGLCLTDNGQRELLQRTEVDERLVAVLHVPPQRLPKASLGQVPWAEAAPQAEEAFRLARQGRWQEALRLNGEAYAGLLGLSQDPARAALGAGALTAGLSGTGPSTAAVCDAKDARRVEKALRRLGTGTVLTASLTNAQAEVVRRSP